MKTKPPFLRTPYNYDMNEAGNEDALHCMDETLTQQHMKDECDINVLVARFVVTGEMPFLEVPPIQGDFSEAPTLQDSLNLMNEARNTFMGLEAQIRSKFDNDPARFVDFASDPKNTDQMREWGMWSPEALTAHQQRAAAHLEAMEANKRDAEEYRAQRIGDKGVT